MKGKVQLAVCSLQPGGLPAVQRTLHMDFHLHQVHMPALGLLVKTVCPARERAVRSLRRSEAEDQLFLESQADSNFFIFGLCVVQSRQSTFEMVVCFSTLEYMSRSVCTRLVNDGASSSSACVVLL